RDVERDGCAAQLARERRLGIDGRFEITGTVEEVLNRGPAAVNRVQGEDVAGVEGQLAIGAIAVGAPEALDVDLPDAVVHEKRERQRHAARRGRGTHADVAEVAGRVEALDR